MVSLAAVLLEEILPDLDMIRDPDRGAELTEKTRAMLAAMGPFRLSKQAVQKAGVSTEPEADGQVVGLSDEALRKRWRAAGGSFHGPNVEHGIMAEARLLPFLRTLATSTHEFMPLISEALERAHPTNKPTTSHEFEFEATVVAHQSICEEVADSLRQVVRHFDRDAFLYSCGVSEEDEADDACDDVDPPGERL
ncbi:MAG: hypothetical protein JWL65_2701 [Gammaproteobacteria bacterium]|nr:hypothetical protein [Gammaproteobacteria bacterium]